MNYCHCLAHLTPHWLLAAVSVPRGVRSGHILDLHALARFVTNLIV